MTQTFTNHGQTAVLHKATTSIAFMVSTLLVELTTHTPAHQLEADDFLL